jgi:hypothetical protein
MFTGPRTSGEKSCSYINTHPLSTRMNPNQNSQPPKLPNPGPSRIKINFHEEDFTSSQNIKNEQTTKYVMNNFKNIAQILNSSNSDQDDDSCKEST